jgi:hypothetical protein
MGSWERKSYDIAPIVDFVVSKLKQVIYAGDIVQCVDPIDGSTLERNNIYEVIDVKPESNRICIFVKFQNKGAGPFEFSAERFIKLEEVK